MGIEMAGSSSEQGKGNRESPYAVATSKGVGCRICPHNCFLAEGEEGICRTHMVLDGKLCTTAYGNPCAAHADPVEKKPLFHFLPGTTAFSIATAGCNFTCDNCQNAGISQILPEPTQNETMSPEMVVEKAILHGCRSVAYTYSEPVAFYEYMFDTARYARSKGVKNLMISNGYINETPLRDLCKYLDGANIDLKSFDDTLYRDHCGGRLKPVLKTLTILKEEGIWLEITNLIIPGVTDDLKMIKEMCEWLVLNGFADNPLHFSRFHPMHRLTGIPRTPLETLEKARNIALEAGLRYVYIGNVPETPAENTYCPSCKKVLIERRGFAILANNLKGKQCRFCETEIAGVWTITN
jgi:pyruvate formate lyase activating enzyme